MEKIKMQPTRPEDALLTDAFADFLEKCRAKNLSEKTLNIYKIKELYPWHPHAASTEHPDNRLYLATDYGVFENRDSLLLSKPGQPNRRLWNLPAFCASRDIFISWQGKNTPVLVNGHAELNSACRGQEFVITAKTPELEKELRKWAESLIGHALA